MVDQKERERRSRNVIVFGIKQSEKEDLSDKMEDDKQAIASILDELKFDKQKVVHMRRFRQKDDPNYIPPILLQLDCERSKIEALSASKNLRGQDKFKNIYIKPDLTEAERKLDKQLRQQRNEKNEYEKQSGQPFRWGIRGYGLRRFKTVDQPLQQHQNQ